MNPGGGGYGNPLERPVEKVVWDVRNGLVSIEGAREDYGVVITDPRRCMWKSTWPRPSAAWRRNKGETTTMKSNYRLGIDAGGTFTDFVMADRDSGQVRLFKALSTPQDPTKAIENGLKLISEETSASGRARGVELRPVHQRHDGRPERADHPQAAARPA
jgi:hypothetical protein